LGRTDWNLFFPGQTNHAGTTPMNLRRDALVAAAELDCRGRQSGTRHAGFGCNRGFVEAKPGATNVIAGEARVTLDIRHASDHARTQALDKLIRQAESIAARRAVTVKWRTPAFAKCCGDGSIFDGADRTGDSKSRLRTHRMASGAGHDAMILAERVPAAMIFFAHAGASVTIRQNQCIWTTSRKLSSAGIIMLTQACGFRRNSWERNDAVHNLGQTRSSHQRNHILPNARHVRAHGFCPGMKKMNCNAAIGPGHRKAPLGPRPFTEYTVEFETQGRIGKIRPHSALFT